MDDDPRTFRANLPAVAHEAFDDEAILIHFESGRYYSLNATGKAVWTDLLAGATVVGLVSRLAARHAADAGTVRAAVAPFVAELLAQGLVVAVPETHAAAAPSHSDANGHRAAGTAPPAFTAPRLEVFSDMQDLLLLDPIHDVDEAGWPHGRE